MKIKGYDEWKLQGPPEPSCEACGDTGQYDCMNCGGDGEVAEGIDCPACDGSGLVECDCREEPEEAGAWACTECVQRWQKEREQERAK